MAFMIDLKIPKATENGDCAYSDKIKNHCLFLSSKFYLKLLVLYAACGHFFSSHWHHVDGIWYFYE